MELTLTTKYDKRFICQSWEATPEQVQLGSAPNLIHSIQQRMVDTEDAGIRKALVAMGWTPPAESKAMLGALLRINEEVWPLVHGLTGRQTLRNFMRTLPSIINWRNTGDKECKQPTTPPAEAPQ